MLVSISDLVAGRPTVARPPRTGVPDLDAPAVVTWQLTRPGRAAAVGSELPRELDTDEGLSLVDAIAASGARELRLVGAPLARLDLFEFVSQARMHGLRTSIATSGAWLTNATAERLRAFAVGDVQVELMAPSMVNGARRLEGGDVRAAAVGYLRCAAAGQEAALAVPLTVAAAAALEAVFDFAELHEVRRLMLLRLPVAHEEERGAAHAAVRSALTTALRRARRAVERRQALDVTIADDFLAAPFAVTLLAREERMRAQRALPLLETSVLAGTRETRATVDAQGQVTLEPDGTALGDVRDRPFDVLWRQHAARAAAERSAVAEPAWPTWRCGPCQWVDVCGVHDRARGAGADRLSARAISTSCYLTDDEIGLRGVRLREPPPLP